ncbi:MAG: 3-deoxy-D-manno-octulosonic acid transferase [Bacteroidales bacterium]
MGLIYSMLIHLYGFGVRVAALFGGKAKLWRKGRIGLFEKLENDFAGVDRKKNPVIWFHVSSLGEFEQGRPVLEAMRAQWPEKRILLSFFSPSGYEVRKNFPGADFIFYLPLDTPSNARRFLATVQPEMVFFVKYDFWFNFMKVIHDLQIPLYYISVILRKDQHFFKWYGGWSRSQLRNVTHFFVQNQETAGLLKSIGVEKVTVTGDTRFDRVFDLTMQPVSLPLIEKFCAGNHVFVIGSSWEPDEAICNPLLQRRDLNLKFIIAPHDTSPARIKFVREHLNQPAVCYSELKEGMVSAANILIIDSVGILSQLYRFATVAFIGGGFGSGIHNIQEPITFGVPVFFGPNYTKFREAMDLVALHGAFSVTSPDEIVEKVAEIIGNPLEYKKISSICTSYVENNRGATKKVMEHLE